MRGAIYLSLLICLLPTVVVADYTCANGYVLSNNVVTNFFTFTGECPSGQHEIVTRRAYVISAPGIKCGPNQYRNGDTCVAFDGGDCASGYNNSHAPATYITAPIANNCNGVHKLSNTSAYAINSVSTKCGPGAYMGANGCESWTTGDGCPINHYTPTNQMTRPDASGSCSSGVRVDDVFDVCRINLGGSTVGACTPQRSCTASPAFHAAGGHSWPLFMDKATNPSMGFKIGSDVCYMNLLPGRETNNLNIKDQNENIYHGVK